MVDGDSHDVSLTEARRSGLDNRPRRRAIAANDTQRETNQIAPTRWDTTQVEPFDDPNPGTKKDAVGFGTVFERTNRGAVDPDSTKATRGEIGSCLRRDSHVVFEKLSWPVARRVSSLEKQPFSRAYPLRLKFVETDDAWMSNRDDSRWPDGCVDRAQVDGTTPLQIMKRRVDMRPGMRAHRKSGERTHIAAFHVRHPFEAKRRITGPGQQPVSQRHGHIEPLWRGHLLQTLGSRTGSLRAADG